VLGNVSFELHTYTGGVWKIDSVYDDRQIAVYEAQRLHAGGRYSAVRVVEERFDGESGKITSKTVFRASKTEPANADALERQKAARHEVQEARRAVGVGEFEKGAGGRVQPLPKSSPGVVALTLIFAAVVVAGIGALIALRYLFSLM
jgi:hypothetical protein